MFGEPKSVIAESLGVLREINGVSKRLAGIAADADWGEIEDGIEQCVQAAKV